MGLDFMNGMNPFLQKYNPLLNEIEENNNDEKGSNHKIRNEILTSRKLVKENLPEYSGILYNTILKETGRLN